LGTTVTNQNHIHREIKRVRTPGMLTAIEFRIFFFSFTSLKKITIKIYKYIISPLILYRCETCSFTQIEELILRVTEKRVLTRKFGPKRE
jgi:hypothetical protein